MELRSRKFRLETEVDGLIAKYDEFMTSQQEEIENIQEAYDIEKEQLDELRARYEKLKGRYCFDQFHTNISVDYDKIIEERRLAAEEEERQRKEFEMKVRSDIFLRLRFFRRSV